MAKGKSKPASKPKVVKAEPLPKKEEAIKVKKKEPAKKVEKKVETKVKKVTKHSFPDKQKCKHLKTKRTIDRRLRVMFVCVECKKVVRFGGR